MLVSVPHSLLDVVPFVVKQLPDVVPFRGKGTPDRCSFFSACARQNDGVWAMAQEAFREMKSAGLRTTGHTFKALLEALRKAPQDERSRQEALALVQSAHAAGEFNEHVRRSATCSPHWRNSLAMPAM